MDGASREGTGLEERVESTRDMFSTELSALFMELCESSCWSDEITLSDSSSIEEASREKCSISDWSEDCSGSQDDEGNNPLGFCELEESETSLCDLRRVLCESGSEERCE